MRLIRVVGDGQVYSDKLITRIRLGEIVTCGKGYLVDNQPKITDLNNIAYEESNTN